MQLEATATENLVRKICRESRCLSNIPLRRSEILSLVKLHHPGRYETVEYHFRKDGIGLPEEAPKRIIVDYFLGLDLVLDIDGVLVGVDVTVNKPKVDEKMRKLDKLKATLKQCEIEHCIVFNLDIRKSLTEDDKTSIFFKLLDAAEYLIDSNKWSLAEEFYLGNNLEITLL